MNPISNVVKLSFVGVLLVSAFIVFLMTFYTVDAYERVVLTRWGAVVEVQGEGIHFKVPMMHSVTTFRTDIQRIRPKVAANTYTIDNQEVDVVYDVFYRIPADKVEFVYRNAQDYVARLEEIVTDRLKAEMGQINVQHVAEKRGEIRDKIKSVLFRDAQSLGISVTDFQLTNLEYTKSFRAAVEQAASAKAGVETREQEKQQAQKNAERAQIEALGLANANRERARGEADGKLLVAEAEAKAIKLKGEAEAAAIEAQTKALAQNTNLVELRKAERWSGNLPTSMLSNVMPFMNVDALAKKN